jgi:polyphenol oxidase
VTTAFDPAGSEVIGPLAAIGVRAFTTGRAAGSYGLHSDEPVGAVMARWSALRQALGDAGRRLATSSQVHGRVVVVHEAGWEGWLRTPDADGHLSVVPGTAMAVTVADCVPVFIGHPTGAAAVVHSGWRGTAAGIVAEAVALFRARGMAPGDLVLHAGPSICGECYEVGPDVYRQITGLGVSRPTRVDLRSVIAAQARESGVRAISVSDACTRCDNERFYSHRCGDAGRQLGMILTASS